MQTVLDAERAVTTPVTAPRSTTRAVLTANLTATVGAAASTEALTGVVRASGVHLAVGNPGGDASSVVAVNAGACTVAVVLAMVFGTVLATAVSRFAHRPALTYQVTAAVLVALSLLAPLAAGATSAGTKLTLVAAHLLAAAVVVPIVTRSLARADRPVA
jgi:hypothetical protein